MNNSRTWTNLPEEIKRQAAPDMLAGKDWYFQRMKIEHPGADELRRWGGEFSEEYARGRISPDNKSANRAREDCPQVLATIAGSATPPLPPRKPVHEAHSAKAGGIPKRMTCLQKRYAVDSALLSSPGQTDRELSRTLGVSHTFIALRRRKAGNVAAVAG